MGRGEALTERGRTLPVEKLIGLLPWVEEELSRKYEITTYFSMPDAFKKIQNFFNGNNAQCHIFNIIGVIATGDVSICGIGKMEPDLVIGNIRDHNLADLWENSSVLNDLRETVPRDLKGICGKCILKNLCLGTCRAHAFVLSRDLTAPDRICQEAYEMGLFPETRIA
jgi:radical SAM protein with 4Fe4S-binding SPASM domain